jgi:hypothetical protein
LESMNSHSESSPDCSRRFADFIETIPYTNVQGLKTNTYLSEIELLRELGFHYLRLILSVWVMVFHARKCDWSALVGILGSV